jgi:F-type H+-transporting ATPase subunit b
MMNVLMLAFQEGAHAAHAAGHPEHSQVIDTANWLPSVTALVVFVIAFGVLAVKVWPQIVKGLDDRENKIRDEIRSAEEAREQAKAALAEYERSLSKARDEANAMITQARADAKATAEELRSRSAAELAEMKMRAAKEIETARQVAITSIYNEAANLGASIAGKILHREINARDQQGLVDASLQELAKTGRN